ncbi:Sphingosine-1-phosphate lyase [Capsicum baccatum]|uniref:Sphingosine-1-phosphate lyase n=1 Tax=Capsicum baccatum TaxID=33114 RepID=A0A2G2VMS2_CAPBA|nr:Sphingosine-1-phosphate lyase [Capsicum baccatum]
MISPRHILYSTPEGAHDRACDARSISVLQSMRHTLHSILSYFPVFVSAYLRAIGSFTSSKTQDLSPQRAFVASLFPSPLQENPKPPKIKNQALKSIFPRKPIKIQVLSFELSNLRLVPGVKKYIDSEKQKIVDKLQGSSNRDGWRTELPKSGLGDKVLVQMKDEKQKDVSWQGKCSGTVFAHTNPLHLNVFPSVVRFEAEVVAMTAAILGSKEKASGGQICGNMTSGGTESILLAVKSSRDYMKAKKGITKPEMIIPVSAHSAYDKAAQYFKIKLWRVPVDKEFRADVKAIKRHINKNTVMKLGDLASSYQICLHVDLCLGGFVLPFACKLGYPVPPFDFTVQGVTSISVDVHKYGLAPKGTSVVLYRNREIRKV